MEQPEGTWGIAVKWGIVLGAAVCLWTLGVHALGWYTTDIARGKQADQVAGVLPVVVLFLAIYERGRRGGRAPTLGEAMGTGVLAGLVSIPIAAGFLWFYHHVINPQWLDLLIGYERGRMTRSGATPEAIDQTVNRLRATGTDSAQITGAIVGTLVVSAVISIVVWAALRLLAAVRGGKSGSA